MKYCASELCLSPGYFGDLIRETLGENPKDYIRGFVVMRAKNLLLSGMSVTQVSEQLGFEYPNHFTRLFKQITGQTPSQFLNESVAEYRERMLSQWSLFKQGKTIRIIKVKKTK